MPIDPTLSKSAAVTGAKSTTGAVASTLQKDAANGGATKPSKKGKKTKEQLAAEFTKKYGYAPDDETGAQRFARIQPKRLKKAVSFIRAVAKLANRGYEYTPEQAAKIVAKLTAEVTAVQTALSRPAGKGAATTEDFSV